MRRAEHTVCVRVIPMSDSSVIVLDFETTGLSPRCGDRAIEIGAVRIEQELIVDRFQGLMNPGFRISSFIESYTGIKNEMLEEAPPCEKVMEEFAEFIGNIPLIAHNASFDRRFLEAELAGINRSWDNEMTCSMLVARRVYQTAPNHKLGTLVRYCNIETDGTFHRALADAEMTARLWISMIDAIRGRYGLNEVPFKLMQELSKITKARAAAFLQRAGG